MSKFSPRLRKQYTNELSKCLEKGEIKHKAIEGEQNRTAGTANQISLKNRLNPTMKDVSFIKQTGSSTSNNISPEKIKETTKEKGENNIIKEIDTTNVLEITKEKDENQTKEKVAIIACEQKAMKIKITFVGQMNNYIYETTAEKKGDEYTIIKNGESVLIKGNDHMKIEEV